MSIEQYDIDDIKIRSKYLDLRLRPSSIMVTRLFSENVNLPLVTFTIEEEKIVPSFPAKITTKDNVVYFDSSNLSGNVTSQNDSLSFKAQALTQDTQVGIMWPVHNSDCYLADNMSSIDKRFTTTGTFNMNNDDPMFISMNDPVIHMVSETCLTIFSKTQDPMKFCFFYHNCVPYWNVTTNVSLHLSFCPCPSRRDGLSLYYQKHDKPNHVPTLGPVGIEEMKERLYNAIPTVMSIYEKDLTQPKKIQKALDSLGIKNCAIGSLAMYMHGFSVEVKDFDMVVDDIEKVKKHINTEASESLKWSQCGARLKLDGTHIDFVELEKFNWSQVEQVQGINILNISGMLLMKLTGEYERLLMEPNYDNFKLKNHANIDMLIKGSSFVYPFFDKFSEMYSMNNYMDLQKLLFGTEWDSVPMKINDPLIANVFSKGNITVLPIINNGSKIDAKVRIERIFESAQWFHIGQDPVDCVICTNYILSDVAIPQIETLGLLVCQNA